MTKIITTIAITLAFLSSYVNATQAKAPERSLNEYSVQELVSHFASQYQVSSNQMLATIKCESGFRENAIGDGGKSYGLSQIHLPSHPNVTKEQATDKVFAIEFMAKAFSKGKQRQWTCWRMLYL